MEHVEPLELARRLIRARQAAGLTQVELAESASKSPATISGLESGKIARPQLRTILALAEALGVEPSELAGGTTAAPKGPPSIEELLKQAGVETRWAAMSDEEWNKALEGASGEEARQLYLQVSAERGATQAVRWPLFQSGTEEERRVQARMVSRYFLREAQAASAAKDRQILAQAQADLEEELAGVQA